MPSDTTNDKPVLYRVRTQVRADAVLDVERIIATIDAAKFDEVRAQFTQTADEQTEKYLDLKVWIEVNLRRARSLDLDRSNPKRVLDLGCGCGYFLHVCQLFGHAIIGIDRTARPRFYRDMTELLGIPVVLHDVMPYEPLPDVGELDVITAHMVKFDRDTKISWGVVEWDNFLADLEGRLVPGGLICLELNQDRQSGTCYTPAVEQLFKTRGAIISGYYPYKPQVGGHRLVFRR